MINEATETYFDRGVFLPVWMIHTLKEYVIRGVTPGNFMYAVLSNDLKEAFGRADECSASAMRTLVTFCYNEIPGNAWGSPEIVDNWVKSGGLKGQNASRYQESL